MSAGASQKNGNRRLAIVRGGSDASGRRRSIMRTREELALMDRQRQRFLSLVTERGTISRAIGQIAAGDQQLNASAVRRILELKAAGVPADEREEVVFGEALRFNRALDSQHKPAA